jgi:hypothetical protein
MAVPVLDHLGRRRCSHHRHRLLLTAAVTVSVPVELGLRLSE